MTSDSLSDRILGITLIADIVLIFGYIISAAYPEHRIWPIGDSSSRWWLNWSALTVVFTGFPVLAYLDWDSFAFTDRWCKFTGGSIAVLGMGFALSALFELGWMESSGKAGQLQTDGIYEYTRNPQSVGFITFVVGAILATNSRSLAVHGLLTITIYFLFPFAEEPWLREHYGEEYEEYCDSTPRFVGRGLLRRLIETSRS